MVLWYDKMVFSRKIHKLVNVLQDQDDRRLTHKFFPKLMRETFEHQIVDHLTTKRYTIM